MEDLWPHCDTCHYISFNGFPIFNGLLYFTSRYDGFHHCCWFCLMQCLALYFMLAWNSLVASADPELMAVLVPHPPERFLACHLHLPNVKQYRLVYIPLKHLPREFSHCCWYLPWKQRSYTCVKLYIKSLVSGSKRAVSFGSNGEWLGNPQALPRSNDGTHGMAVTACREGLTATPWATTFSPGFYSPTTAVGGISGFTYVTKEACILHQETTAFLSKPGK